MAPGEQNGSSGRAPTRVIVAVLTELGLATLWNSSLDVKLLCAQRFVRLFAYGCSTLILASYLSALEISDDRIGLFMTLTLIGDVAISFLLTLFADAMGRRAVLALGSVLMVSSGVVFAVFGNYWVLLLAAILGVISPSGNEIGPFRAVEESTLAHLTSREHLGDIFVWYSLIGTAGAALGIMFCGWFIDLLQKVKGWEFVAACQAVFFLYAAIGGLKLVFAATMSRKVEAEKKADSPQRQQENAAENEPLLGDSGIQEAPESQQHKKRSLFPNIDKSLVSLLLQLMLLFGLDSFASGLASLTWMTYFFKRKFDLPEGKLGSIFFTTSIIAAASMLVASSIAKRIGNVKTMVFTHLPSAICLALVPIPSILPLALTFLILRACSQSMDVAPRSAFLATALPADKRTSIMGAINVVKTCTQSAGPLITGVLAQSNHFGWSFTIAGILKATYDIGMLICFAGKEAPRPKPAQDEDGEDGEEER